MNPLICRTLRYLAYDLAISTGSITTVARLWLYECASCMLLSALSSYCPNILQRSHLSRWCTTDVRTSVREMLLALFSLDLS